MSTAYRPTKGGLLLCAPPSARLARARGRGAFSAQTAAAASRSASQPAPLARFDQLHSVELAISSWLNYPAGRAASLPAKAFPSSSRSMDSPSSTSDSILSQFELASSTWTRSGPLSTLYDGPIHHVPVGPASPQRSRLGTPERLNASPARLMLRTDEEEVDRPNEALQGTPPRRLLDLFMREAGRDSPSAKGKEVALDQDEAAPSWSFYRDDSSEPLASTSIARTGSQGSDISLDSIDSISLESKENNKPTPLASPFSAQHRPSVPPPTTSSSSLGPSRAITPTPDLATRTTPTQSRELTPPSTPSLGDQGSPNPWLERTIVQETFGEPPSLEETGAGMFAEGGNDSFESRPEGRLLPGFLLAAGLGSPKKRVSGEYGKDGVEKRRRGD